MFQSFLVLTRISGMLLGLAIYNNITLDVNFPPVLFKKILGYPGSFDDLEEAHPIIYRSMVTLLQYEGELPVEDCFCLSFEGRYTFLSHNGNFKFFIT